jgi:hypothetical protein
VCASEGAIEIWPRSLFLGLVRISPDDFQTILRDHSSLYAESSAICHPTFNFYGMRSWKNNKTVFKILYILEQQCENPDQMLAADFMARFQIAAVADRKFEIREMENRGFVRMSGKETSGQLSKTLIGRFHGSMTSPEEGSQVFVEVDSQGEPLEDEKNDREEKCEP